jgi:hypothetical protein
MPAEETNLPQQFWGRWARFTSPEGADFELRHLAITVTDTK